MELLLLSIALAMDAAVLSIANGAKYRNLALSKILFIAFVFGFFQAAMPLAGYFLGAAFARFIAQIDHFIAFAILGFLGAKMIREACRNEPAQAVSLDTKDATFGRICHQYRRASRGRDAELYGH